MKEEINFLTRWMTSLTTISDGVRAARDLNDYTDGCPALNNSNAGRHEQLLGFIGTALLFDIQSEL